MPPSPGSLLSGDKHAVRFRMSQHQLAYKKKAARVAGETKKRRAFGTLRAMCWVLTLLGVGAAAYVALRNGVNSASFFERAIRSSASESNNGLLRGGCAAPAAARMRFFAEPVDAKFAGALVDLGWEPAADWRQAEVLWFHEKSRVPYGNVKCWQVVNHLVHESIMGHKGKFYEHLRFQKNATNKSAAFDYLPATYALWSAEDRTRFEKDRSSAALEEEEKASSPAWVLKEPAIDGGKSVEIVTDASMLFDNGSLLEAHKAKLLQKYVRNLLLIDGHKFDLRVYWCIARHKHPALVLYHPGTLRVSSTKFSTKFDNGASRSQHLTNAAQQNDDLQDDNFRRRPMSALWDLLESSKRPGWPPNPRAHVDCEIRRAVASIWLAFADTQAQDHTRAFALLGLDIMIDQDLNIFLSEVQSGPGLPTRPSAAAAVLDAMIPALADIVTTLHTNNNNNKPLNLATFDLVLNGSTPIDSPSCHHHLLL